MEKQVYFAKVRKIEELKQQIDQLNKEWNEQVCWFGSAQEVKAHEAKTREAYNQLNALKAELKEARKGISKETLIAWRDEFYQNN